ncbi:MAG: hypothetical protein Aurels2KO_43620 [Aureliella sp.]
MTAEDNASDLDADTDVGALQVATGSGLDEETQLGDGVEVLGATVPVIPGYEVIRELGHGGMGVVYLARDHTLDRLVALKTFKVAKGSGTCQMLTAEARLSGRLNHAAIVPVFEVNAEAETPYFAMAYVDGEDLARRITSQVYSPLEAARLGAHIASAIAHAHAADVLHLDLKPANILLCRDGSPKVTDFGLFAFLSDKSNQCEGVVGTPQFMSPEQALQDNENIGPASDVYSIGAVLYAAITGRPPLVASNNQELVMKVASQRPRHLQTLVTKVPVSLDTIVMKCLEKSPSKRYESAKALQQDLEAFCEGRAIEARPTGFISNIRYQIEKHVLAASVSGSLVLLLVLFTIISIVTQAIKNHYDVVRLEKEIEAVEQLYTRMHKNFVTTASKSQHEIEVDRLSIESLTKLAMQLSESGSPQRAATFAANAISLADVHDEAYDSALAPIIRAYKPEWAEGGGEGKLSILEMANVIEKETHYTSESNLSDNKPDRAVDG